MGSTSPSRSVSNPMLLMGIKSLKKMSREVSIAEGGTPALPDYPTLNFI